MSLRVWLPLTKDLRNQGLSNVTITNNGATYSSTGGKLGGCYSFDGNDYIRISMPSEMTTLKGTSVAAWVKSTSSTLALGGISNDVNYTVPMCTLYTSGWQFGNDAQNGYRYVSGGTIANTSTWHHVCCTVSDTTITTYLDGVQVTSGTISGVTTFTSANFIEIGCDHPGGDEYLTGSVNDFRVYDHCLSLMEVKELSKGLVLHYPLNREGWGQENLFIDSTYEQADSSIANSSTDWSKYFRRYNGSAGIHSFSNYTDTITLSTTGNLGVTFQRKATDINLDSTSYYTISCEAKSTQTARPLCIGLSYYNNSNSWVWRGGSNPTYFKEVNKWQKFTLTFKPDADTQYIDYCFTVTGVSSGTDTFSIRHCKLEKGSIATPWCPNSSDNLADEMGLNETTEYDCSGYCNNGTRTGTFEWTSDTPKYEVSTSLSNNVSKLHISGLSTSGFGNSYSIAWWGKTNKFSGLMQWGFSDGIRLNGIFNGNLWNTGDSANNPLYIPGTTTQVIAPTTNEWHHFVMTGDGTTCKVYKDGELWGQAKTYKAISGTSIYFNGWDSGTSYSNNNGYSMSDFRIYATALSASDVKSLYQNSAYIDSSGNVYGAVHSEV